MILPKPDREREREISFKTCRQVATWCEQESEKGGSQFFRTQTNKQTNKQTTKSAGHIDIHNSLTHAFSLPIGFYSYTSIDFPTIHVPKKTTRIPL